MTTHLCELDGNITWKQIKQSILGHQKSKDMYTCGGCSRTFETICCLHLHCMKHDGGGSYHFDHVTNTAFPKYDTRCSASQYNEDDMEVTEGCKIMIGNGEKSVNIKETNDINSSFVDSSYTNKLKQSKNRSLDMGKEGDNEITADRGDLNKGTEKEADNQTEQKGFIKVKGRNIERREDGSILFEMLKCDTHLIQVTADTIVKQLQQTGEIVFESDQEMEFLVPDESTAAEISNPEHVITMTDEVLSTLNSEACSRIRIKAEALNQIVNVDTSSTEKESEKVEDATEAPDMEEHEICTDSSDSVENVQISTCNGGERSNIQNDNDNCDKNADKIYTEEDVGRNSETPVGDLNKTHTGTKKMSEISKKNEMIENLNLTPTDLLHATGFVKRGNGKPEKEELNKSDELPNYTVRTRPERKRKLTAKMRESELPDSLKLIKRKHQPETMDRTVALKEVKGLYHSRRDFKKTDKNAGKELIGNRHTVSYTIANNSKDNLEKDKIKAAQTDVKNITSDECLFLNDNDMFNNKDKHFKVTKGSKSESLNIGLDQNMIATQNRDLGDNRGNHGKLSNIKKWPSEEYNLSDEPEDNVKQKKTRLNLNNEEILVQMQDEGLDYGEIEIESKVHEVNMHRGKHRSRRGKGGALPVYKRQDLKCEVCGKVGSMNMIKYHKQMHSNEMPFKCDTCGKCFKTEACKKSHVKQHGERKWKCDLCPAAFFRKQYLDMHMTNHTGELPFMCELCGMKFRMAYIVRRHINSVHKNIRDYKCDICEKTFFRVATRDSHRLRHYEPTLNCSYCPKKFKADLDLRKHELTHTGEKQFYCPLCNHGFLQIWPYYKHMWRIHNVKKEEAKAMKIRNPDIVNMRCIINKNAVKKETGYVHEFIGKPGGTFDMGTSLNVWENRSQKSEECSNEDTKVSTVGTVIEDLDGANVIYTETNTDLADAIVLNIGEDLETQETIVIQSADLQNADSQQTGYIVVDESADGSNIVIYSDFPENEIHDLKEYTVDNI